MNEVWVHMILGAKREPFLEAALRSVEWADGFSIVNTAPDDGYGQQNEQTVRNVVPREKLRLERAWMNPINFSKARNLSLEMIDDGDYALIVDGDDVHYPEWETFARNLITQGHDIATAHFWHIVGYKNLWKSEPHREIMFLKTPETRFAKSVHEALVHPRNRPALAGTYHYWHGGYLLPPREIFKRWVLYSELEGDPNHYAGRNPDDALQGWMAECQPFWRDPPPAVAKVLEDYPEAPRSARALPEGVPCNIGLVMLTWDDAENLKDCLASLATTRQPFKLMVVDNGSTDDTWRLVDEWRTAHSGSFSVFPNRSLAEALNHGFRHFMDDPDIDYIGWIHPDMTFERDTWLECLREALDNHPDIAKAGAQEIDAGQHPRPEPGNTQCFLIRKSALERVGLFDEGFVGCGGKEDWDLNKRLLEVGRVMIWPSALIRHIGMATRGRRDTDAAGRANAAYYFEKWQTDSAPV